MLINACTSLQTDLGADPLHFLVAQGQIRAGPDPGTAGLLGQVDQRMEQVRDSVRHDGDHTHHQGKGNS